MSNIERLFINDELMPSSGILNSAISVAASATRDRKLAEASLKHFDKYKFDVGLYSFDTWNALWIVLEEGCRKNEYLCPTGHNTSGIGHNLDEDPIEVDETTFLTDYTRAVNEVNASWLLNHRLSRYRMILYHMCFHLGLPTLNQFVKFRKALNHHDLYRASMELQNSKMNTQTPNRVLRYQVTVCHSFRMRLGIAGLIKSMIYQHYEGKKNEFQ